MIRDDLRLSWLGPFLFLLAVIAGVVAVCGMMNDGNNRYPGKLLLAALVLGLLGYLMLPALAHDHSRPDLQPWFESLRSRAKAACCDGTDARLDDVDRDSNAGRHRVGLNGQ